MWVILDLETDEPQSNIIYHHVKQDLIKPPDQQTWFWGMMCYTLSINTGSLLLRVTVEAWLSSSLTSPWFSSPNSPPALFVLVPSWYWTTAGDETMSCQDHGSFCAMIMTVWFLSGPWLLLVMCSHLDSLVSVNTRTNITGQFEGRSMGTLLKIQVGFIMDHCF